MVCIFKANCEKSHDKIGHNKVISHYKNHINNRRKCKKYNGEDTRKFPFHNCGYDR